MGELTHQLPEDGVTMEYVECVGIKIYLLQELESQN